MTESEYKQRFICHMVCKHGMTHSAAEADYEEWPVEYDSPEDDADACFFYFYGG